MNSLDDAVDNSIAYLYIDQITLDEFRMLGAGIKSKKIGWVRTSYAKDLEPEMKKVVTRGFFGKEKVSEIRDWDQYVDNCIIKCLELAKENKDLVYRIVQTRPPLCIWEYGFPRNTVEGLLRYKED